MTIRRIDFNDFFQALNDRHLDPLTFSEVRRAVQSISTTYVERRNRLKRGADLDGAGKRAAFALYFGALHLLLYLKLFEELGADFSDVDRIVDLGCGTAPGATAWALSTPGTPHLLGIDRNDWVLHEARWIFRHFGLRGGTRRDSFERIVLPTADAGIFLGFAANELEAKGRKRFLDKLLASADRGARIAVVEPIARRINRWWDSWAEAFERAGGKSFDFRREVSLPRELSLMDKAAGLDHSELKARVMILGSPAGIESQ